MTSNRDRAEWPELFGEALLASAALDRLTHGAHFVEITGQSFRAEHTKKQLTARRARGGNYRLALQGAERPPKVGAALEECLGQAGIRHDAERRRPLRAVVAQEDGIHGRFPTHAVSDQTSLSLIVLEAPALALPPGVIQLVPAVADPWNAASFTRVAFTPQSRLKEAHRLVFSS